jgi:hypothetical protein
MEYIAKYNLGGDVPFVPYANPDTVQDHISNDGRGGTRPGWDLLFNHYVNIKGIAAPYTAQFAAKARPEGGGGNYGPNSGGFDQLGFTTLTATLDPIAEGAAPSCLSASVSGSKVTLSWWGSLGATSYIVRRASTSNSVFSTIGTVSETTYVDTTATVGEAYVYRVVAAFPGGKTKVSNLAAASLATKLVARYALNETVGTIAKNSVDRTFAATLMNGASWATAPHAVSLNGDKQYVALPDNIVSDLNDFTICAWVNVRTAKSWARIFDFGKGRVSYLYLGLKGTDGSLQFSITGGGGGGEERITGDTPLKLGEWHHVAVTIRDGTGTLYLDGKVIGTNPHMNLTPAQLGSSSRNFIGKSQYSDPDWDGYLDPYLDGEVADFRIYRGALTRDDVASLAAARPK